MVESLKKGTWEGIYDAVHKLMDKTGKGKIIDPFVDPDGSLWNLVWNSLYFGGRMYFEALSARADVQDNKARLIDPYSGELISSLQLAGRPRWCAYSMTRDQFLVNIREPSGVAVLTPENLLQKTFLPVSVAGPHGLDIDDKNGLAYVACDAGAVVTLDISTGHEKTVVPIGGGPDVAWLNAERHRFYCAIGNPGVIEVIDTRKMVVDERVKTEEGAHTFTFDKLRQRLYAFLPKSCRANIYKET